MMNEEIEKSDVNEAEAPATVSEPGGESRRGPRGARKGGQPGGGRGPRPGRGDRGGQSAQDEAERNEWKEKVIQIRRVTKVVKGGKKLSFRAVVVVGNEKGQVGIGVGKSNEVIGAIQKAVAAAKKSSITVPIHKTTIPHTVTTKAGGSVVVLLPASEGTGVIAGGAARAVIAALSEENGIAKVIIANRSPRKALEIARIGASLGLECETTDFHSIQQASARSNLIVNTTPIGTKTNGEDSIIDYEHITKDSIVYDIVYKPVTTNLLENAKYAQAQIVYGYEMLLEQGAKAFEIWTGMTAPRDAMKRALFGSFGEPL